MVRVTAAMAWAVPLGSLLGLGLWTLVALVPRVGAARLATRIAPYVADISPEARDLAARRPTEPATFIGAMLAPLARAIRRAIAAVLGGDVAVAHRLVQAGWRMPVETFRARQLLGAVVGASAGTALAVALVRNASVPVPAILAVVVLASASGVLLPDQLLARAARIRRARIAFELPTMLEFITMALSAGEGILDALRRTAATGNGAFAEEMSRVVAHVNAGVPIAGALRRCADEIALPALDRTVDQLVGALERGTPLIDVLRAQAQDSRDEAKRLLLESAGKKEIAMLLPLVFLILPVTVAFALVKFWVGAVNAHV